MLRLIVVLIAVLAGGAAGWLALQATWREPVAVTAVVEAPQIDVLTPNVDLLRGAKIAQGHLGWGSWPEAQVKPGMILKAEQPDAPSDLVGRALRSNLYAGEPLRKAHLAEGAGGFLSLALQPGMLALGVQISDDTTAGGFILPNDQVDVLHTVVRDVDGDGTATGVTRTILTNLRVLAIGQTTFKEETLVIKAPTEEGAAVPPPGVPGSTLIGKTATLEVSGEQAEVLLAAAASGRLALGLRAAEDFGLSGIGDLEMIEGDFSPALAEPRTTDVGLRYDGGAAEATMLPREVVIISTGVPRRVVTGYREQPDE